VAYLDRHLQRTSERGPSAGSYDTIVAYLPTNASTFKFKMPYAGRLQEISRFARTSTAGTLTVANGTTAVTWLSAASLTADTVNVTSADTLTTAGSRECAKGDQINITGGGTSADVAVVLTFWVKDHVAAANATPTVTDEAFD
jgi:hypothetical protein